MSIIQNLENGRTDKQHIAGNLLTELQEDILTGKIKAGSKLTEQKICDEYKVSRTPVREALYQLQAMGLIEYITNRGAFVLEITNDDINDNFELQSLYEVQCAKYAAMRITKNELEELTETFEFMEFYTMKNDIPKMININTAFHQIIYNATHNKVLINIMKFYKTYERFANPDDYYTENYLQNVLEEHRAIYNALLNRDIALSMDAMMEHVENTKRRKHKKI